MPTLNVLSLGAGVQSSAVYLMAVDGRIGPIDVAIFADTQEEPQAVYRHLNWLMRTGSAVVPILVPSIGSLGEHLLMGRNSTNQRFASIPAFTKARKAIGPATGVVRRQCSKEYKAEVVARTIRREVLGLAPRRPVQRDVTVVQWFGISRDEARRAVNIKARVEGVRNWKAQFPLLDMGWTRADCLRYLADRVPHPVPRSACVFCPYKSDAEWRLTMADPAAWARAVEIDHALRIPGNVVNRKMDNELFLHRSGKPIDEVDFDDRQWTLGFMAECEGMCGN